MNKYTVQFFAECPNNGIRILYTFCLSTLSRIMVEDLSKTVAQISDGYHEDIADHLHKQFGGLQVLSATHHGVEIVTTRGSLAT